MAKKAAGTMVPWDDIPERSTLPSLQADFKVSEVKLDYSSKKHYKQVLINFTIKSGEYKGMPYYLRCTVGMEDDPEASDPKTWVSPKNVGARHLMSVAKYAGIKMSGKSLETVCEMLEEGHAELGMKLRAKEQTEGEYAGNVNVDPQEFYKYGEREAKVFEVGDKVGRGATTKKKAPIKTKARAARDEDDDDDGDEDDDDEPAPAKKAKATKRKAAPVDDDDDEDEEPAPRRTKRKVVEEDDEEEEDEDEDEEESDDEDDDSDDDDEDEEDERPRRARGKK